MLAADLFELVIDRQLANEELDRQYREFCFDRWMGDMQEDMDEWAKWIEKSRGMKVEHGHLYGIRIVRTPC